MKKIIAIMALINFLSQPVLSCIEGHEQEAMFPKNDLQFPVGFKSANMDEKMFNDIIDNAITKYQPIFRELGFKALKVNRLWSNNTVNASAQQGWFSSIVNMYGGLARHPKVTPDAFALVLCHEIGHHIGGAPKNTGGMGSWATSEGQADFWGTAKCTRRLWQDQDNQAIIADQEIPEILQTTCEQQFNLEADVSLCIRSGLAGISLGETLASLGSTPIPVDITTPDPSRARSTINQPGKYPSRQCRLDTYVQGAYCQYDYLAHVSQRDPDVANCTLHTHDIGYRPECWFVQK